MQPPDLSRTEDALYRAALAGVAAFWLSSAISFPGFGAYDEEGIIAKLQFHAEGWPLPWGLFRFSFWHQLLAAFEKLSPGNTLMLRLPALILLLGEAWLLKDVVSRRLGARAGIWAALADLLSAYTFIRSRSLLPWGATPFFTLGLLAWMDRARSRPWSMAACGAAASALLLEYEAWPMAGLWLTLEALRGAEGVSRGRLAWLAGAVAGAAVVGILTSEQWGVYAQTRVRLSSTPHVEGLGANLGRNLLAWVWPQKRVGFLGPDSHPVFPPWALAGLALGAWTAGRRWPWLLAAAAAGMLPAISALTVEEPNRYIAAWTPLCIMAGLGMAKAAEKGLLVPLALAAALGGAAEWAAGRASIGVAAVRTSAQSLQWREAAKRLKATAPPQGWELISGLGRGDDAAFRFLAKHEKVPLSPRGRSVALLNWEYLPAVAQWGMAFDRRPVPFGERSCALIYPSPTLAASLRRDAATLAPLHFAMEFYRPPLSLAEVLARQASVREPSPLLRTALAEMDFMLSWQLLEGDPERVKAAVSGPLVSAEIPWLMAQKLELKDPAAAAIYARLALKIDPRRMEALELVRRLGQKNASRARP